MTELDRPLSPGLDATLHAHYAAIEPSAAFAQNLEEELRQYHVEILSNHQSRRFALLGRERLHALRTRPLFVFLTVLVALLLLSGVAYAVAVRTGFIPGFGFTSGAQTVLLLEEPVEMTVGEVTVLVDQAVSDADKFWVHLTATNVGEAYLTTQAALFLLDGTEVDSQRGHGGIGDAGEASLTYVFAALPLDTEWVTLVIENLEGMQFELQLQLRPAEADEILPAQPVQPVLLKSATQAGITLVLDHIAADRDKTVFQVSVQFDQDNTLLNTDWHVTLTGADGAVYPAIEITPDTMEPGDGSAKIFQTVAFDGDEQLTLALNTFPDTHNLPVMVDFSAEAIGFTFDPGPNPVSGQTWALDEVVQVGDFTLHAVSARLATPTELLFEFEPVTHVRSVMLYSPDPLLRGAANGNPQTAGNLVAGLRFERIPEESFEVRVMRVVYAAQGTWEITWQPPAALRDVAARPTATVTATRLPLVTATPTLVVSNPILLEVQQLAEQFDAQILAEAGWIHAVTEMETNPQPGQIFPPPYLLREKWIEVDNEGYVIRQVLIDKDGDGNTIQMSASIDGYSVNFTTGDAGNYEPYRYSADLFLATLVQVIEDGSSTITRTEVTCPDGGACVLIELFDALRVPAQHPGETQAFTGAGRRVWIDLATGQQVQTEAFWQYEDGTERVDHTNRAVLIETVSAPPQEILDILANVVVP